MDKVSLHSRPSVWRILLKYGVPLLVTIGLCYILFTGVDVKEMMRIIRTDCNFAWIAAGSSSQHPEPCNPRPQMADSAQCP